MYSFIKPLLFSANPEKAHHLAAGALRLACNMPGGTQLLSAAYAYRHPSLSRQVFGLQFPNPVGLAAGFDKNGEMVDELAALGFGFLEVGTVTPKAQAGNDKPRLFRLPKDEALINRMGFNNEGADAMARRLDKRKSSIVLGVNIGKNKVTPNEDAVNDYLYCMDRLYSNADYFTVNVSSPNTPGLRELQEKEPLKRILDRLMNRMAQLGTPKPLLLKIAPDLTDSQIEETAELVLETGIQGVVATNTTIARNVRYTPAAQVQAIGAGGLSGLPVRHRATEVVRLLANRAAGKFAVVGVGGIDDGASAKEKLDAGANLIQVYTGFVYKGPGLPGQICKNLVST